MRKGFQIQENIPSVGKLAVKSGVAGVHFDQNLVMATTGMTAKVFQDTLFKTHNNLMNNKLHEPDANKFMDVRKPPRPSLGK